ncbi:MAG: FtsB family cell division protein [Pyrinomonadaceae bacterium]
MSKAANIYWDDADASYTASKRSIKRNRRPKAAAVELRTTPFWLSFAIVVSIFVMLGVSINFRAFTEMKEEANQNTRLAGRIQNLMDENLALQEEIHSLKSDPKVIEREARRVGIGLRQEKVPVTAN